jgi:hypothetical protein
MRRLMLAAAVGGTALMSAYGIAVAQVAIELPGAGFYVGPIYYGDDYDYDYGYDRRYYHRGYRYYDGTYRRGQLRSDFNLCGRYAYWDGHACQPGRRY